MKKDDFLADLERSLGNISISDRNDILYDYREHFSIGLSQGKTEVEICEALGDPRVIARQYKIDCIVRQAEENRSAGNILRVVVAALSLSLFNLIFILPFLACLIGILAGLYGVSIGVTAAGAGLLLASILQPLLPLSLPNINMGILVFASVGTASLGLLFTIGTTYITKFLYNLTLKYIKANIRLISR